MTRRKKGSSSEKTHVEDLVGYCKPPRAHQFKPGQSGNMKGRPKKKTDRSTLACKALNRKVTVTINGKTCRMTIEEIGLRKLADKSAAGNIKAFSYLHAMSSERVDEDAEDTSAFDEMLIEEAIERRATAKGRRHD
ncbi:DUF5681 domain-containing protein [Variibacter gotjawalensis]|uniref:DUF5681 domain-containing protein n=1 Tax=Variibacter gotjawalensis TaxID=1333996 RepID=UPI0024BF3A59|nr:DUF5681 domain-containing protein [Variibacter gotjawalensis]